MYELTQMVFHWYGINFVVEKGKGRRKLRKEHRTSSISLSILDFGF